MIVRNKYTGEEFVRLPDATMQDAKNALDASKRAFELLKDMPAYERYNLLSEASRVLERDEEEFARIVATEAGKPLRYSRGEVRRAALTLLISAEESRRMHGETVPLDIEPRGVNRFSYYSRVPIGTVLAITPFNDPLNLAAHKIGPALASGNAVINKPSSLAPYSALKLKDSLLEAGFPDGSVQTLIADGESDVTRFLVQADEIGMISFTGGSDAAEDLVRNAGVKKYSLELGNNSPVIIWSDADLDRAAELVVDAAFEAQGQNCIHAQRILIKDDVYEYFRNRMIELTSALKVGDPLDPETDVGPMISEDEAIRVEGVIENALEKGARLSWGGARNGSMLLPTILESVDTTSEAWKKEIFGPVAMVKSVSSMEEAIQLANDVPYGLQAGFFTSDLNMAFNAIERLNYGTVLINDTSDFRIDSMPFGGVKKSGIGREGVRFAMEEMTDIKLAVIKR